SEPVREVWRRNGQGEVVAALHVDALFLLVKNPTSWTTSGIPEMSSTGCCAAQTIGADSSSCSIKAWHAPCCEATHGIDAPSWHALASLEGCRVVNTRSAPALIPARRWLGDYRSEWLRPDLVAGL